MKNLLSSVIAAPALAVTALTGSAQDILFQDTFNDVPTFQMPRTIDEGGPWLIVNAPGQGVVEVVDDFDDQFGYGISNRFLRISHAGDFLLRTPLLAGGNEVVTLSFDFIDRSSFGFGNERLSVQFFASVPLDDFENPAPRANDRANILGFQGSGANVGIIRQNVANYDRQVRSRLDMILNNDPETLIYSGPHGETRPLAHGRADVWIDGRLHATNYVFSRGIVDPPNPDDPEGPIEVISLEAFASDHFNIDIDNFTLFAGAHVLAPIVEEVEPELPPFVPTGTVLLQDDFQEAPLGAITWSNIWEYPGPWTTIFAPSGGEAAIVLDAQDLFGKGTDNKILRLTEANAFAFRAENSFRDDVLTLSYRMHHEGQFSSGVTDRLTSRFFSLLGLINNPSTVINFGFQQGPSGADYYYLRNQTSQRPPIGEALEWALIVNNGPATIAYASPEGPQTLAPGMSAVWMDGARFRSDYNFGQDPASTPGMIRTLSPGRH